METQKHAKKQQIVLKWPQKQQFTIKDIFEAQPPKTIAMTSINNKLLKAIKNNQIKSCGKLPKNGKGRPETIYSLVINDSN